MSLDKLAGSVYGPLPIYLGSKQTFYDNDEDDDSGGGGGDNLYSRECIQAMNAYYANRPPLSPDRIARIVNSYMINKKDEWELTRLTSLEASARDIYLSESHHCSNVLTELVSHERYLKAALCQLYQTKLTDPYSVRQLCNSHLSGLLYPIFLLEWKYNLLRRSEPPPPYTSLLDSVFGDIEYPEDSS